MSLRDRRPISMLADPIVGFHHVVTRRALARFEDRDTTAAWRDAQTPFRSHVFGPYFEGLAHEFTRRFVSAATIGGQPATVGVTVLSDATNRSRHEVDVVAAGHAVEGAAIVMAIGEARCTVSKRTRAGLARLEHIRALIARKHPSAPSARLCCSPPRVRMPPSCGSQSTRRRRTHRSRGP